MVARTKWRYMHLVMAGEIGENENKLDEYGAEGWEVVGFTVVPAGQGLDFVYLLKLPIGPS